MENYLILTLKTMLVKYKSELLPYINLGEDDFKNNAC